MPDVNPKPARKTSPSWSDVKGKLADFDRAGLIGLVQALYVASKDNPFCTPALRWAVMCSSHTK